MKKLLCLAAAAAVFAAAPAFAQNVKNYEAQGGADTEIGGVLNVQASAGGALKVNGVAVNLARGEVALGGSNPTAVATGLTSLAACQLTLKEATAPGVNTTTLTYTSSGGALSVYAWKPTSSANPTLIASTGTETFGWVCLGS